MSPSDATSYSHIEYLSLEPEINRANITINIPDRNITDRLVRHKKDEEDGNNHEVITPASNGNWKHLLQAAPDANYAFEILTKNDHQDCINGYTPLMLAADLGDLDATKNIYKQDKKSLECRDINGESALTKSVFSEKFSVAEFLFKQITNKEKMLADELPFAIDRAY